MSALSSPAFEWQEPMDQPNGRPSLPQVCHSEVTDSSANSASVGARCGNCLRWADGSGSRLPVDVRAGVPDPMLSGAFGIRTRGARRHRDGCAVGDHLNDTRLADDDRVLEPDVGQRRCGVLASSCRKCLQQNRYRDNLDTVVVVRSRVGLGRGGQTRLPQMRRRRRGDDNVPTEQSAGFGRGFGCLNLIFRRSSSD